MGPIQGAMSFDVDAALHYLVENEGSDLHVKVPSPPMVRVHGELQPIEGSEPLKPADTEAALNTILADERLRAEFAEEGEVDFSYAIQGLSRFRVSAFRQRGSVSIAIRAIPFSIRSIDELGLPPVIRDLAEEPRGIILLTGTTGSGKSTTLAAMIDHINQTRPRHVITLEDPIEYLHRDKRSIINQREVGDDTASFPKAMRRVLRQDPDVILIGEMRDEETVRTALSAAETGHLVMSTLHTVDATETVNRIIDFFPPHLQHQARVMLASTLRGAVSQRLVQTPDENGRVAVCEVLVATGRVRDLILNPNETGRITEVIAEGGYYGMQTFDQALLKHVMAGNITEDQAMEAASSPHDFKLMLSSQGQRASGMEQVMGSDDEDDDDPGAEQNASWHVPRTEESPEPIPGAPAAPVAPPPAAAAPVAVPDNGHAPAPGPAGDESFPPSAPPPGA